MIKQIATLTRMLTIKYKAVFFTVGCGGFLPVAVVRKLTFIYLREKNENRHILHSCDGVSGRLSISYKKTGCEKDSSFFLPCPPWSSFFLLHPPFCYPRTPFCQAAGNMAMERAAYRKICVCLQNL